jgi:hypothetical protein
MDIDNISVFTELFAQDLFVDVENEILDEDTTFLVDDFEFGPLGLLVGCCFWLGLGGFLDY